MKSVLVTGGAGFIGSHLVESLLDEYHVVVLDNFSTGKKENLPAHPNLEILQGDITDADYVHKILLQYNPAVIYHLAAIASVQESVKNPEKTHQVNFKASQMLINKAAELSSPIFIFASSAAVYGENQERVHSVELSAAQPISQYGNDKLKAEQYLLSQTQENKIKGVSFRFFNVYGERQNATSPYSGVLSIFKNLAEKEKKPQFSIYGDGTQVRDFIYVKDVVNALKVPLKNGEAIGRAFNVGTGKASSLNDIVKIFQSNYSKNIVVKYYDWRKNDIRHSQADCRPLSQLNWKASYSLQEGLGHYIKEKG